jgi:hypothetical protein
VINKRDEKQKNIHKNHNGEKVGIKNSIRIWEIAIKFYRAEYFSTPMIQTANTQQKQNQNHTQ